MALEEQLSTPQRGSQFPSGWNQGTVRDPCEFPSRVGQELKGRNNVRVSDALEGRTRTHTEGHKQQTQCVFKTCVTSQLCEDI